MAAASGAGRRRGRRRGRTAWLAVLLAAGCACRAEGQDNATIDVSDGEESDRFCTLPVLSDFAGDAPRRTKVVAGRLGLAGRIGDGGLATNAQLHSPTAVVVDPLRRRLLVTDRSNHAVRIVDLEASRIDTAFGVSGSFGYAGRGIVAPLPELRSPRGLWLAAGGEVLYIADTDNHVVRVADLTRGDVSLVAGVFARAGRAGDGGPALEAQFNAPRAVVRDAAGRRLYISDTGNHAIRVCDISTGRLWTLVGILGSGGLSGDGGEAQHVLLHFPYGIALDEAGQQLFVAEPYNHAVRAVSLASGELSKVAGTLGVPGFAGDDGPAVDALLHFPYGLDFDSSARQLFLADANNHVVRLVDMTSGLIWRVAGVPGSAGYAGNGNLATEAQLAYPTGVAVDAAGRKLYVADRWNHAIRSVDLAARVLVTLAGELGEHGTGVERELLIGLRGRPADPDVRAGAGAAVGGSLAWLHSPRGLAFDPSASRLFVADASNLAIRSIDVAAGLGGVTNLSTAVGPSAADPVVLLNLKLPCGVAVDMSGSGFNGTDGTNGTVLWIADAGAPAVFRVDLASGYAQVVLGAPALALPYDVVVDAAGLRVFIADAGRHVVYLLDAVDESFAVLAGMVDLPGSGGDGGPSSVAELWAPSSLALDEPAGLLYIADTENHAVRSLDLATGLLTTLAGTLGAGGSAGDGGPAGLAQLYFPYGVAVDPGARQLFIADNWNHAIRHMNLDTGLLITLAGVLGSRGFQGEGGRADEAQLYFPMAVAFDAQTRRLFLSDSGNHAVRVVGLSDEMRRCNTSSFGLV